MSSTANNHVETQHVQSEICSSFMYMRSNIGLFLWNVILQLFQLLMYCFKVERLEDEFNLELVSYKYTHSSLKSVTNCSIYNVASEYDYSIA